MIESLKADSICVNLTVLPCGCIQFKSWRSSLTSSSPKMVKFLLARTFQELGFFPPGPLDCFIPYRCHYVESWFWKPLTQKLIPTQPLFQKDDFSPLATLIREKVSSNTCFLPLSIWPTNALPSSWKTGDCFPKFFSFSLWRVFQ